MNLRDQEANVAPHHGRAVAKPASPFKLCLVGNSSDGCKGELMRALRNDSVVVDNLRTVLTVDGRNTPISIWDMLGQERFRSTLGNHLRGAQGLMLCYDVTDRASFTDLFGWIVRIKEAMPDVEVPICLVGTRRDRIANRVVTEAEGKGFADQQGLSFFEVSAKDGIKVEEAFQEITRQMVVAHDPVMIQKRAAEQAIVKLTGMMSNYLHLYDRQSLPPKLEDEKAPAPADLQAKTALLDQRFKALAVKAQSSWSLRGRKKNSFDSPAEEKIYQQLKRRHDLMQRMVTGGRPQLNREEYIQITGGLTALTEEVQGDTKTLQEEIDAQKHRAEQVEAAARRVEEAQRLEQAKQQESAEAERIAREHEEAHQQQIAADQRRIAEATQAEATRLAKEQQQAKETYSNARERVQGWLDAVADTRNGLSEKFGEVLELKETDEEKEHRKTVHKILIGEKGEECADIDKLRGATERLCGIADGLREIVHALSALEPGLEDARQATIAAEEVERLEQAQQQERAEAERIIAREHEEARQQQMAVNQRRAAEATQAEATRLVKEQQQAEETYTNARDMAQGLLGALADTRNGLSEKFGEVLELKETDKEKEHRKTVHKILIWEKGEERADIDKLRGVTKILCDIADELREIISVVLVSAPGLEDARQARIAAEQRAEEQRQHDEQARQNNVQLISEIKTLKVTVDANLALERGQAKDTFTVQLLDGLEEQLSGWMKDFQAASKEGEVDFLKLGELKLELNGVKAAVDNVSRDIENIQASEEKAQAQAAEVQRIADEREQVKDAYKGARREALRGVLKLVSKKGELSGSFGTDSVPAKSQTQIEALRNIIAEVDEEIKDVENATLENLRGGTGKLHKATARLPKILSGLEKASREAEGESDRAEVAEKIRSGTRVMAEDAKENLVRARNEVGDLSVEAKIPDTRQKEQALNRILESDQSTTADLQKARKGYQRILADFNSAVGKFRQAHAAKAQADAEKAQQAIATPQAPLVTSQDVEEAKDGAERETTASVSEAVAVVGMPTRAPAKNRLEEEMREAGGGLVAPAGTTFTGILAALSGLKKRAPARPVVTKNQAAELAPVETNLAEVSRARPVARAAQDQEITGENKAEGAEARVEEAPAETRPKKPHKQASVMPPGREERDQLRAQCKTAIARCQQIITHNIDYGSLTIEVRRSYDELIRGVKTIQIDLEQAEGKFEHSIKQSPGGAVVAFKRVLARADSQLDKATSDLEAFATVQQQQPARSMAP